MLSDRNEVSEQQKFINDLLKKLDKLNLEAEKNKNDLLKKLDKLHLEIEKNKNDLLKKIEKLHLEAETNKIELQIEFIYNLKYHIGDIKLPIEAVISARDEITLISKKVDAIIASSTNPDEKTVLTPIIAKIQQFQTKHTDCTFVVSDNLSEIIEFMPQSVINNANKVINNFLDDKKNNPEHGNALPKTSTSPSFFSIFTESKDVPEKESSSMPSSPQNSKRKKKNPRNYLNNTVKRFNSFLSGIPKESSSNIPVLPNSNSNDRQADTARSSEEEITATNFSRKNK